MDAIERELYEQIGFEVRPTLGQTVTGVIVDATATQSSIRRAATLERITAERSKRVGCQARTSPVSNLRTALKGSRTISGMANC